MDDKKKTQAIAICFLMKARKLYVIQDKKGFSLPTMLINTLPAEEETKLELQEKIKSTIKLDITRPQFLGQFNVSNDSYLKQLNLTKQTENVPVYCYYCYIKKNKTETPEEHEKLNQSLQYCNDFQKLCMEQQQTPLMQVIGIVSAMIQILINAVQDQREHNQNQIKKKIGKIEGGQEGTKLTFRLTDIMTGADADKFRML